MLSVSLLNYSSDIPPRDIHTLTGRGSNRPSLLSTPACATSVLAGRALQPTFCRVSFRTSAPSSWRFRRLTVKTAYTPSTTTSSCSSFNRLHNPRLTRSTQSKARLVERWVCSHLRTTSDAPLGHAGLPLDIFRQPRHHAHFANARTFLLVDWYENLHPAVASPLRDVSSTETFAADGPLAHHLNAPA